MFCRINSWRWLYSWRIQAEDNSQDTPDGSDIDLFSGIYNTVVTISEQEDTRCVDCEIYQPLVLQEKTQHWKKTKKSKLRTFFCALPVKHNNKTNIVWGRDYEKM